MNELDLIEHFQTFDLINVDGKSLISEHLLDDIFDLSAIKTVLIFDLDSHFKAIFLRFIDFDIYLLILEFIILEFNSGWAVMIARVWHDILGFHKHSVANAADIS